MEDTKPRTEPHNAQTTTGDAHQSISLNTTQMITGCALGLIICFFLPWVDFSFFGKASGFDLAKAGAKAVEGNIRGLAFLWAIPFFGLVTILAGMAKQSQKKIATFTGALPFAALAFGIQSHSTDLIRFLAFGAYLSLFFGLILLIVPTRLK